MIRRQSRTRSLVAVTVLCTLALSCRASDGTGPGTPAAAGIEITAGTGITDTIGAQPAQALRVVVHGPSGAPLSNAVVRFTSIPVATLRSGRGTTVYVGDLAAASAGSFAAETTSSAGVASVRVVFGTIADTGAVEIAVPAAGFADTARYTIRPGAAKSVLIVTIDTTVQVGQSVALHAEVRDRAGNPRPDPIAFQATDPAITVSAAGVVGASAPARGAVIGQLPGTGITPDTTWVSAVPAGTIAWLANSNLYVGPLDGTGRAQVPLSLTPGAPSPEWNPNGKSLLATLGAFGGPYTLDDVTLAGSAQLLLSPTTHVPATGNNVGAIEAFSYSADGQWLYVTGSDCNEDGILYRAPATNPAALTRLSPSNTDDCFHTVQRWPSPSPDGTRLAFESDSGYYSGYTIAVMTLATNAITSLNIAGQRPRWSPDGKLIAYAAAGQIWVVAPDGSGVRAVSPAGHPYNPGVAWSPDGKWLLAAYEPRPMWAGTTVALLNVSTGQEIPLPWTTGYPVTQVPVWKPVP